MRVLKTHVMMKSLPFCKYCQVKDKNLTDLLFRTEPLSVTVLMTFSPGLSSLFTLALAEREWDLRQRVHESRHFVKVIGDATRTELLRCNKG